MVFYPPVESTGGSAERGSTWNLSERRDLAVSGRDRELACSRPRRSSSTSIHQRDLGCTGKFTPQDSDPDCESAGGHVSARSLAPRPASVATRERPWDALQNLLATRHWQRSSPAGSRQPAGRFSKEAEIKMSETRRPTPMEADQAALLRRRQQQRGLRGAEGRSGPR